TMARRGPNGFRRGANERDVEWCRIQCEGTLRIRQDCVGRGGPVANVVNRERVGRPRRHRRGGQNDRTRVTTERRSLHIYSIVDPIVCGERSGGGLDRLRKNHGQDSRIVKTACRGDRRWSNVGVDRQRDGGAVGGAVIVGDGTLEGGTVVGKRGR